MRASLKKVDCIIEVHDARISFLLLVFPFLESLLNELLYYCL